MEDLTPVTVRVGDATIHLDVIRGSHQDRRITLDGAWERHITIFLAQMLRKFRAPVFFDVGANIGYYSVLAEKLGATRVAAFEPAAGVRQVLERNVERNGCASVVVDGRIVGPAGARLRMVSPEGFEEGAFAAPATDADAEGSVTIDEFCAETGLLPSIVKIDVEGRDLDVLQGGLATLAQARPLVVFEFQHCMIDALSQTRPADLFPALREIGYTPYLFRGHSGVAVEMVSFPILQQIYDLAVETGNAGCWDVALWPARLGTMVKPFDRSRLEPA